MRSGRSRLLLALFITFVCVSARASSTRRLENLEVLANVWRRAYLFHPHVVKKGIDYERALVAAIPAVEQAETDEALLRAIEQHLLLTLDDPEIRIFRKNHSAAISAPGKIEARRLTSGVGLISIRHPDIASAEKFREEFAAAYRELAGTQKLIVDLRWPASTVLPDSASSVLTFFITAPVTTGPSLRRQHSGWSERNEPSVYLQNWLLESGERLDPVPDGLPIVKIPMLFVINNASHHLLSRALDALQRDANVAVVWEKLGDTPRNWWLDTVSVGQNFEILIPDSVLLSASGGTGFRPDRESDASLAESDLLRHANELLPTSRRSREPFQHAMQFPMKPPMPAATISREERIAALVKIWAIVNTFNPHLEFASAEWASVLRTGIPAVENAKTTRDYYMELRRITASLNDSHVTITHPSVMPAGALPVELKPIGQSVVVRSVAEGVTSDIRVGDEIIAMDGEPVMDLEARLRPFVAASTPGAQRRNIWRRRAIAGDKDTNVRLTIARGGEKARDVEVIRVEKPSFPKSAAYRRLEGNIGYVNLFEIPNLPELDHALKELADTSALVLDLRGYPKFWITRDLMARLVDKPVPSTRFVIPIVDAPSTNSQTWRTLRYEVQPDASIRYRQPVAVLIDENTQSMAEDFCIYIRNARRALFVGSQTAGTNGNITTIDLPAGGRMTFTGMRVLFDDGSRFQNIGIQPDVEVRPTIEGIRSGRDEVLLKAVEVLSKRF